MPGRIPFSTTTFALIAITASTLIAKANEAPNPSQVPSTLPAKAPAQPPSVQGFNLRRLIIPLDKEKEESIETTDVVTDKPGKSSKEEYTELPPWGYEPRETDESSQKGAVLYKQHNCQQCHSIEGKGGEVGPPLDGIGGHRGPEWLLDRLMDPEEQMKNFAHVFGNSKNLMPHPALTKDEANHIVSYILTLPEPKEGYLVATHTGSLPSKEKDHRDLRKPDIEKATRGAKLFYDMHCYTCHSTDGSKDRFGPDLAGIGSRTRDRALKRFLKRTIKSPLMKEQTSSLSNKELSDLKEFLLTIPEHK